MPFTHSFDTVGWLAKSAVMMERAAGAFACPAGQPPTRLLLPVDVWAQAGADTVGAVGPRLAQLEAIMGPATPILLAPDGLDQWREAFRICQAYEIWDVHKDWTLAHEPDFGPGIKERFEIAAKIDPETFAAAQAQKATIRSHMREIMTPETVLVLPTSPGPAPLRTTPETALNDFRMRAFEMLCVAGLNGLPQLSMPAGSVDGGPVGLSLVGDKDQDQQLIALGRALEPDG
jgi:amidase